MKKRFLAVLIITLLLFIAPVCVQAKQAAASMPELESFSELSGKTISMLTGAPFEELVKSKEPNVEEFTFFNSTPDMIQALKSHKTDAFLTNNAVGQLALNRNSELALFPENLQDGAFGFAFAKGDNRRDEWQAAFDKLPQSEIDAAWEKWTGLDESVKTLPEQDWDGANGTVRVAACDTLEPMSYVGGDNELKGFDLELILMIARELNVKVEFTSMEFSAILAEVQSGKADIGVGSIIITEERAEAVDFVEYYPAAFVLIVRAQEGVNSSIDNSLISSLAQLDGKRIGVQTGTTFDEIVLGTLPNAIISYFNSYSDMAAALEANKIDGFPGDEPVLRLMASEDDKLTILDERMDNFDFGFVLAKNEDGEKLLNEINEWLAVVKGNGELDEIVAKWVTGADSEKTLPDYAAYPAPNGTLTMATEAGYAPMNYYEGNEVVGFEIELAARFCEAYGYGLNVEAMNFDGILPAVQTGKADFAAAGITITEERKESVNFSEPYYTGGTLMAVLKGDESGIASEGESELVNKGFLGGIKESFNKTFIREGRWRLFVSGVLTTLLITILTILFGTILGFAVFMLCRKGNPVANIITRFAMWLVQGMPMVVLLMVLYYVIFGSVEINGIAVAVIGFTLTFGASVFGLLKIGVGAVDSGQYEAASALGFSDRGTFFGIILPQALPHVLPSYKGEIVGLIKGTAIVGYIAVQDLTKMGDIVRSRTYEAFFPLIAITIIYFLLEALIGYFVSRISISLNPKRRSPEDIMKGVKIDD